VRLAQRLSGRGERELRDPVEHAQLRGRTPCIAAEWRDRCDRRQQAAGPGRAEQTDGRAARGDVRERFFGRRTRWRDHAEPGDRDAMAAAPRAPAPSCDRPRAISVST